MAFTGPIVANGALVVVEGFVVDATALGQALGAGEDGVQEVPRAFGHLEAKEVTEQVGLACGAARDEEEVSRGTGSVVFAAEQFLVALGWHK